MASTGRVKNGFDLSSDPTVDDNIQPNLSIGFKAEMTRSSKYDDMIVGVEKSGDNIMRFLEGIASRISQLELYCYNIDKSVGQMRSNFDRDQEETDFKLQSLHNHLQEVLRSVQVLRDKQELAETQKELVKLQLVQRESSTPASVLQDEDNATPREAKNCDHSPDMNGQQLALVLSHQVAQQPPPPSRPVEQPLQPPLGRAPQMLSHSMSQTQPYYLSPPQMTTLLVSNQPLKGQYMPSNSQYQASQMHDLPRLATLQTQSHGNQTSQHQSLPTYQQQWSQQVQQLPQSSVQPQVKVSSAFPYPSYMPIQQNPPSAGMVPNSSSMQAPFLGASQAHANPQEVMSYGYVGTGGPIQDQPQPTQQHPKASDGYTLAPGNTYLIYDGEGGRVHHPPLPSHLSQGGYSTVIMSSQNPQPTPGPSPMICPPQFVRNHPYNELIDQLANMGYRVEHVVGAIQILEERGQPVDFNAVLDRMNGRSSGSPHSGWSG